MLLSLQAAWARENLGRDISCHTAEERIEVAIAQARAARPDVVYIQGLNAFPADFMTRLRDACPSIRMVVDHVGSVFDAAHLRGYNLILGCVPSIAARAATWGRPAG